MEILISIPTFLARSRETAGLFQKIWNGLKFLFLRLALIFLSGATSGLEEARAQPISHEYEIKAVFIFNFAQFTDWPTNTFANTNSSFVIGILGNNPFGDVLERTVQNETWNGRKFVVQHFWNVNEITNCQILFIGESEAKRLTKIMAALQDKPILTVSDIEAAARHGVCIRIFTENNKPRLLVNLDSLKASGLAVSSKLLRVAEVVPPEKK